MVLDPNATGLQAKRRPGRRASPELTAQRRREILSTAVRLFVERGYEATSLDDIAHELGFTKGLIYHYFSGKATLLREAVVETMEPALVRQQAVVESSLPADEKLRRVIYDWAHEVLFDYQHYLVTLGDVGVIGRVRDDAGYERRSRFVHQYRAIIEEGIAAGCFRPVDPGVAAQTIVQGILGVARWYRPEGRLSRAEICAEVTAVLLAAVRHA